MSPALCPCKISNCSSVNACSFEMSITFARVLLAQNPRVTFAILNPEVGDDAIEGLSGKTVFLVNVCDVE